MTLCFSAAQALLAAKAGATYISPFVGRIDDAAGDGMDLVQQIVTIYQELRASNGGAHRQRRHPVHFVQAALIGAHVATMPLKVIKQLIKHPLTDVGLAQFLADAKKIPELVRVQVEAQASSGTKCRGSTRGGPSRTCPSRRREGPSTACRPRSCAGAQKMLAHLGLPASSSPSRSSTTPAIHELNRTLPAQGQAHRRARVPVSIEEPTRPARPARSADRRHGGLLGDVILSIDTARRQAGKKPGARCSTSSRCCSAHGLLHLLGYDHQTDAEEREMTATRSSRSRRRPRLARAAHPRSATPRAKEDRGREIPPWKAELAC